MLGYEDIIKELGKGISVFPFKESKIKGNALNLSVSEYAWSLKAGEVWVNGNGEFFSKKPDTGVNIEKYVINERQSAVIEHNNQKYVIVFPLSSTLIETQEVIAVSNRIGGTYHSKVSLVSKGACHIGTYLEPNYRGHSLVTVQNLSENIIVLCVGATFVAITFFYLKTAAPDSLLGAPGGRFEILLEGNISVSAEAKNYLSEQWKNSTDEIRKKMEQSKEFIRFMREEKKRKYKKAIGYLSKRNIGIVSLAFGFLALIYFIAYRIDRSSGSTIWTDRFWDVGCSGLIVTIVFYFLKLLKDDND